MEVTVLVQTNKNTKKSEMMASSSSSSMLFFRRLRPLLASSPLVLLLLLLLPIVHCSSSSNQSHSLRGLFDLRIYFWSVSSGDKSVLELIREMRLLGRRVEKALGRRGLEADDDDGGTELMSAEKRAVGIAPSVLWNGGTEKRAQLPYSGRIECGGGGGGGG